MSKTFQIPVLLKIPAESYEEAMKLGANVAESFCDDPGMVEGGIVTELVTYFEHDNIGQRVLYLHPEEDPDYENTKNEDEKDEEDQG